MIHDNGLAATVLDATNRFDVYSLGADNNSFYYNVLYNGSTIGRGGAAFYLDEGSQNWSVYNNTIYNYLGDAGYGLGLENGLEGGGTQDNILKNNIISNCYIGIAMAPIDYTDLDGNIFDYNCIYKGTGTYIAQDFQGNLHTTLAAWQFVAGSPDAHSISSAPFFTDPDDDDFTLQPISPCIDAGTDVGLTQDYAGNGLSGSMWDIGSFGYKEDNSPLNTPTNLKIFKISMR